MNMKKILFLTFFFLMAISSFAQESQHLEFKGVPLDGKLSSFVSKLEKKSFTFKEYARDYVAVMKGGFAGDYVTIYIYLQLPNLKLYGK